MLLPIFRNYLIELICKEENKMYVISKINQHVDLPKMTEEEESKIMEKIYDAVSEITKTYMGKIE